MPSTLIKKLNGDRFEIRVSEPGRYPEAFQVLKKKPGTIYGIGEVSLLSVPGLAIVGARKASYYGLHHATRFGAMAAEAEVTLVTGGAIGIDTAAMKGVLGCDGKCIVVLGSGCNQLYPAENASLFQQVIDRGGLILSEQPWDMPPRPYAFRARNRLVSALSNAVFVIEAGLPSGTFSTVNDALEMGKGVLALPGSIDDSMSVGPNTFISQHDADAVIDRETFFEALCRYNLINRFELNQFLSIPADRQPQ